MQGSLGLGNGLLFVGRHEKTAHVSVHDLDGRALPFGFSFKDELTGRSEVTGLAVDPDRHVWVADAPGRRVRRFNVFGREIGGLPREGERAALADEVGAIAAPVDVALVDAPDTDEGFLLAVASGGERRHAVQLFRPDGACEATLRPAGDRAGRFHHVRRVAALGNLLFVVESGARRLQVFRGRDFHYHVQVPGRARAHCEPVAVAPLADGRLVLAVGGGTSALLLCDATGHLLRVLAGGGSDEGAVFHPSDVVVAEDEDDRRTRVAVIDRDGDRVQMFTLEGRCYGAFAEGAEGAG